jgi:hypothetical protein
MNATAEPTKVKLTILLDANGRLVGASRSRDDKPAEEGDESRPTAALAAGPGQSLAEVEVAAELADRGGNEFLTRLGGEAAVRTLVTNSHSGAGPTAGGGPLASSPGSVAAIAPTTQASTVTAGGGPLASSPGSVASIAPTMQASTATAGGGHFASSPCCGGSTARTMQTSTPTAGGGPLASSPGRGASIAPTVHTSTPTAGGGPLASSPGSVASIARNMQTSIPTAGGGPLGEARNSN